MKTQIEIVDSLRDAESLRADWQRLDGDIPFRSFDWLTTWWRHYGEPSETSKRHLQLLVVRDASRRGERRVLGIAPWYVEVSRTRGAVVRPLGGGEVCSDHLGVLADTEHASLVATAIARHLADNDDWDRLELDDLDVGDPVIECLIEQLVARGMDVATRPAGACWAIELPKTWGEFLAMQSKSHRKQLRRADDRVLATERAQWHAVREPKELNAAWPLLVDLHQRRRRALGEPGCFASERFAGFHREVAEKMLAAGRLRLSWLELDGEPVAAEYHFAGANATYAYQGGVDPDCLSDEPGRLSNIATIKAAIDEGHTVFDFLRGDEPYKAHYRAQPRPTQHLRVVNRAAGRTWLVQTVGWADSMAAAVKASLRPLVNPVPKSF